MPSAGGLYLTRGCHFSNLRHVCGDSFHALRCPGASGGGKWKFMSDLCKLSFLSPAPAFASPLACLSRVHFSRYPSNGELALRLSELHLILMFSGPLQQDLLKKKWSLAKCCFKQNYCHACHTRFAVFFTSPSSSQHSQRELGIPVMWGSLYSLYLTYKFFMWFIMADDSKVNFNVLYKPC